jgi:hypothetical protein
VQRYTRKILTFEWDVLNAFSAILQELSTKIGYTFCWGLPKQHFVLALMWQNAYFNSNEGWPLKRRVGFQKGRASFPSWSWAGWIGQIYWSFLDLNTDFRPGLQSDPIWPWDPEYPINSKEEVDVFESGILAIDVQFATLDHSDLEWDYDVKDCRFHDGIEWESGARGCFLLARVTDELKRGVEINMSMKGQTIKHNRVLMVVEQGENGIYYRTGLLRVPETCWALAKPEPKRIQLG